MKNYSYITLLTNDSYVYGVALLVESMQRVKTKYPLHVLVIDEVHAATLEILDQLGVTYEYVDVIPTPQDIYEHNLAYQAATAATWRNCWTKFHIFNQTQFDKIIFLDADLMILKNLDHLFEKPHMTAALDGEYFNIWPDWDHFNSGCLVIKPSNLLFNDILNFANNLKCEELPEYIVADQEVLNFYYKNWPTQKHLHLNKYYNIFAPYVPEAAIKDIDKNCYFIHYVGRKPWTFWLRSDAETYTEYYYTKGKELVEARIQTLDWEKIHSKLILTVYAICKNEITNVDKWLKSFGEADHVCILDTGSTDGTWELLQEKLKEYPNLIIDQQTVVPWRYDKARNISMTLIPKDTTIFFIADLDEEIKEPGWCNIVKDKWDPLFDRGIYTYNRDIDDNGAIIKQIPEYRIHSADWYMWVNIVHEALINHAGNKQFFVETSTEIPITVWHYPNKNKQTNYLELCEEDLKEYPDDWVMHLQLAIEYDIRHEYEKAYNHYIYLINNQTTLQDFEVARCYCGAGKITFTIYNDKEKALRFFREGRILYPKTADNYLAAAEIYYNTHEYHKALELSLDCLKECEEAKWCNVYDIQSYFPYWIIGMSYYFLNEKAKALGIMNISYLKNPTNDIKILCDEIAEDIIKNKSDF